MKDKKGLAWLAALMSFGIAYAGVFCMISGFGLDITDGERTGLFWILAAAAVVVAACFRQRYGWGILGFLVLVPVLLFHETVIGQLEVLLTEITTRYHKAYGWTVIQWSGFQPESSMLWGLAAVGIAVQIAVSWVVSRKKPVAVAVAAALLPLGACCVVTDTVPSEGYLWLLLALVALLLLTQRARQRSTKDGLRLTAILLVPVMLASAVLFWVAPRDSYEAQTSALQQTVLQWMRDLPFVDWDDGEIVGPNSNPGQSVDLTSVGEKLQLEYAVMDVVAEQGRTLYLRGQSFDQYDGASWSTSDLSTGADPGWIRNQWKDYGSVSISTRLGYEMYYVPYGYHFTLELTNGAVANPDMEKEYSYDSVKGMGVTDEKRLDEILEQCLQLPDETRSAAKRILADNGIGSGYPEICAQKIGEYVENSAQYSLNTQRMPKEYSDFAIWFLTESDTGYCVHYATAATVLLRAAGVPARYVTGFSKDVKAGVRTTVTADRAHAWVEYWDEDTGWTVLDPTPAGWGEDLTPPTGTTEGTDHTQTEATTEAMEQTQTEATTEATEQTQASTEGTGETQTESSGTTEATGSGGSGSGTGGGTGTEGLRILLTALWILAGVLLAAAGVLAQYVLRLRHRRKKMRQGDRNRQALYRWKYAGKVARRLKLHLPDDLRKLAEKAAFSQHMLTEQELAEFDEWLAQARQVLAEKPWIKRTVLKLIWAME